MSDAPPPVERYAPTARIGTYRLQFSRGFRFADAHRLLPYLRDLGISHLYASPITLARPGSDHGYDVCDPRQPNPELGTRDELLALLHAVRGHGLAWMQDIVPNHLAMSPHNPFMRDVLRFGRRSRWAFVFDIDWQHADLGGKLLLPILGEPYAGSLRAGAFRLAWSSAGPVLDYGDHHLPLSPASVAEVLARAKVAPGLGANLAAADHAEDPDRRQELLAEALTDRHPEHAAASAALGAVTGADELDQVVTAQPWRLAWWRTGREVVGYRRFFAIDELIAVRVEDPRVFALMHGLVGELDELGLIDGLRVDHIDGLRDPAAYLQRLRARFPRAWILVEKILGAGERLPPLWPVDGTTGYEVLNALTAACCDPAAEAPLTALHGRLTGAPADPTALAIRLRSDIDALGLGGDLDRAVTALHATANNDPTVRDLGRRTLREVLTALLARMTVYRTYAAPEGSGPTDARVLAAARDAAVGDRPDLAPAIGMVADLLISGLRPSADATLAEALARLQHLSGPVMAKGWEDTFFYNWSRCLALNEVGGDPRHWGDGGAGLGATAGMATDRAPAGGLNATSTHDTKRGEDTRARLAAATWRVADWESAVTAWMAEPSLEPSPVESGPAAAPHAEDRYLIFQTLLGTWPVGGGIDAVYRDRIHACVRKSLRESAARTCWTTPDAGYEASVQHWLEALLDPARAAAFHAQMTRLVGLIATHAAELGLVQTVLKCTLPGVPDIYQGCEWPDLSLVDPDNRRPVDFIARAAALAALPVHGPPGGRADGCTKQAVLTRCLHERRRNARLWCTATMRDLPLTGAAQGHFAFARVAGRDTAIIMVRFRPEAERPPSAMDAEPHPVLEPAWREDSWRDILTGAVHAGAAGLPLRRILSTLPCAVLVRSA